MTTLTKEFFGKEADFFLEAFISIVKIEKLDRERSAVKITFDRVID